MAIISQFLSKFNSEAHDVKNSSIFLVSVIQASWYHMESGTNFVSYYGLLPDRHPVIT